MEQSLITPAGFARLVSKEKWLLKPHLKLINRKLLEAAAGQGSRLIVSMPPRHGKSELISKYFPAWYLSVYPENRVILCSYAHDFAQSWGRKARDIVSEWGPQLFGTSVRDDVSRAAEWETNAGGGMITAGVGGPITGRGANLLVIDDPIKNSDEAQSQFIRDAQWDWFWSTAMTRLEPGGSVVIVMTRWHFDDLAGRLINSKETKWDHLALPALALEDDPLGRPVGDALWPERYDVEHLNNLEANDPFWFSALFQQNPVPREGGMFKMHWFSKTIDIHELPPCRFVRYWDRAGSVDGDYTVGILMGRSEAGDFYIVDCVRGRWQPAERDKKIAETAQSDVDRGYDPRIFIEQEAGLSGRENIILFQRRFPQFPIYGDPVSKAKEIRADPFASACGRGATILIDAIWNREFINELCSFPNAKHDDIVDATSGAYNKLALSPKCSWTEDDIRKFLWN